jgi:hypothetical protein
VCASNLGGTMQADIKISEDVASLSIEKQFNDKDYFIGDTFTVKDIIKNSGTTQADNVKFSDDLSGYKIINLNNCQFKLNGTSLTYEGPVRAGAGVSCEYQIRILDDTPVSSVATAEYYIGSKLQTATGSLTPRVKPFGFYVTSSLDNNNLNIFKINRVWFNYTSKTKDTKIRLKADYHFPEFLKAVPANARTQISSDQVLFPKESLYNLFDISSIGEGAGNISVDLTYSLEKIGYDHKDYFVNITYGRPAFTFNSNGDSTDILIENPNELAMNDIKIKLTSDKIKISNSEFSWPQLASGAKQKIGTSKFNAPNGNSVLSVSYSYNLENGATINDKKDVYFNTNPAYDTGLQIINSTNNQNTNIENRNINETIVINTVPKQGFMCKILGWLIKSWCN